MDYGKLESSGFIPSIIILESKIAVKTSANQQDETFAFNQKRLKE